MSTPLSATDKGLRRVVARVALLNLAYFGVEFSVALVIGSVSLFADRCRATSPPAAPW